MKNEEKKRYVVYTKEIELEVVRAYKDDDDDEVHELKDGRKIFNAYRCPDCGDLYVDAQDAADCCEDWGPIKAKKVSK